MKKVLSEGTINRSEDKKTAKKKRRRLHLTEDLKYIIEDSVSFEEDVYLFAKWFQVGARTKKLQAIIETIIEMDKISWPNIVRSLEGKGIILTVTDRDVISGQMTRNLKKTKNKTTAIMFFKILNNLEKKYKDETEDEVYQHTRMICMPEIPWFEKFLENMDEDKEISEKVIEVLEKMGINTLTKEDAGRIQDIAQVAVKELGKINFNTVISKANIPIELGIKYRCIFSTFINKFIKENVGEHEKIALEDFLYSLKHVVN